MNGKGTNVQYGYDDYGNLVSDPYKEITDISYNHLNLPVKITFDGGGKIEYFYDATGLKLKKKVTDGTTIITTDYMDGFQYTNGKLDFFPHAEGYTKAIPSGLGGSTSYTFKYVFSYTDHLGNIRVKYAQNPANGNQIEILEEDHYYPYGLKHIGYNGNHTTWDVTLGGQITLTPVNPFLGDTYKYKFGGKEYQTEFDINTYDFGARNYDPALGRWMNIDPLAEVYASVSPYVYALNNPILFKDPDGMRVVAESEEAQELIKNTLTELLGKNHGFYFNKKGVLKHKGGKSHRKEKKEYSDEQKAIYDGFNEIMSNDEYTIEVNQKEGGDEYVTAEFKKREFVGMKDGEPITRESEEKTIVEAGGNLGWTGGGLFLSVIGSREASVIIFPDIGKNQTFDAGNGELTTPSLSSITIHELLDHGLEFIRTGVIDKSESPSIENVKYQNNALIIIDSNTRVKHHDH